MTSVRNSVVAIIVLLLTMQGVSAVTMPLCKRGPVGSISLADAEQRVGLVNAHHDHGLETGQDTGQKKPDPDTHDKNGLACDDCEVCALNCASTLPSAELIDGAGTGRGTRSSSETLLIGVTPHHLSKPPLLA